MGCRFCLSGRGMTMLAHGQGEPGQSTRPISQQSPLTSNMLSSIWSDTISSSLQGPPFTRRPPLVPPRCSGVGRSMQRQKAVSASPMFVFQWLPQQTSTTNALSVRKDLECCSIPPRFALAIASTEQLILYPQDVSSPSLQALNGGFEVCRPPVPGPLSSSSPEQNKNSLCLRGIPFP